MLYQLYETQRALMAPFSEFASATAKLYTHPLSPFTHTPLAQRVSAGFDLAHRLAKEYEKPEFDIRSVPVNGIEVAAACMSGSEIHFAIAPEWRHRVIARLRAREFLAPLFDVHGFLTTRTEPNKPHHRFLERMGFMRTWNDGIHDHYMMTELPFGERN